MKRKTIFYIILIIIVVFTINFLYQRKVSNATVDKFEETVSEVKESGSEDKPKIDSEENPKLANFVEETTASIEEFIVNLEEKLNY